MSAGARVVQMALAQEGVAEVPLGSNRGPQVDAWEQAVGMLGVAWCGIFAEAMFRAAGVADAGILSPSTALICERADALGGLRPSGPAPPGALGIACGIHVWIVVHDRGNGLIDSIEGNCGDRVMRCVRAATDWRIIVPPAIAADAAPAEPLYVDSFGFDDLALKPKLYGGWADALARNQRLEAYAAAHPGDWTRPVRVDAPAPYAFWAGRAGTAGAVWRFGGWPDKAVRDAKIRDYGASHDAQLRPWKRRVPVPAGAAGPSGKETLT